MRSTSVADHRSLRMEQACEHGGYYNPVNQTYANGVMATYVLPLAIGAVPATEVPAVSRGLLKCPYAHTNAACRVHGV